MKLAIGEFCCFVRKHETHVETFDWWENYMRSGRNSPLVNFIVFLQLPYSLAEPVVSYADVEPVVSLLLQYF